MPATTAAMEYKLTKRDVENIEEIADIRASMRNPDEYIDDEITREDVAEWLTTNSGDFQEVMDFCASIGNLDIEWEDIENAFVYNDCVYGDED